VVSLFSYFWGAKTIIISDVILKLMSKVAFVMQINKLAPKMCVIQV